MLGCWRRRNGCSAETAVSEACGAQPLSRAQAGRRLKVAGIAGGRHVCARMAAMGIYPGVEMELLCAGCGSPCLVRVHGGTLSLGAGVSHKILVTPVA
ncbi:MAG TPA: FeoA family protein [Syntrophobacteraceae bacterium]|nr:FeoA family protein [Syntrophobacteraceae bacterium]